MRNSYDKYDLEQEIINALKDDVNFNFKETARYFQYGKCPECNRKTVYIKKDNPGRIACSHTDSCGYSETTRVRYAHLFENISERYPATQEDPNASANAYMSHVRGFPLVKISNWYSQGYLPLNNGKKAPTVRFNLWDGFYWERLINQRDVWTYGDKNHNKKGLIYRNKCWQPPNQKFKQGDRVFIVEGIFHAIALSVCGYKAVAAFSSGNLPRDIIKQYQKHKITWCLAYDNDDNGAGNEAAKKFRRELHSMDCDDIAIYHCPKGIDWDDAYRSGELDENFIRACRFRGEINSAETLEDKSRWLYLRREFTYKVVDFNNRFYSVSVEGFNEELAKAIDKSAQADMLNIDSAELHKKTTSEALHTETGKNIFNNTLEAHAISNCLPNFLFSQINKITGEIAYNFLISYPSANKARQVAFAGSALESPASFNKALLNQSPGATFDGSANQLKRIRDQWFDNGVLIVETVPFVGYDKDTKIYIFPEFAFYNCRYLRPNKSGFVSANNTRLKTTLKSIPIKTSKEFKGDWANNFFKIFHYNGLVCLAFFLGSLFAEQLRERLGFFPFLELTGEPGSGKSVLLEFCWKLLGRSEYEGFNPSKATFAARSRAFTQVSNMPVVLMEGDSMDGKDAKKGRFDFNELKDLFNGRGIRATGAFNRGNDIEEPPFRGTILIEQNATVDADEAVLQRIVHLHATRAHQRPENKPLADWFRRVEVKEVCGFLYEALSKETQIIDHVINHYRRVDRQLGSDATIKYTRIAECHALVTACVNALPLVLPKLAASLLPQTETHLQQRAHDRQQRMATDHPTVAAFWEIFDLLNVRELQSEEERLAGIRGEERETLNHSLNSDRIAINLQEFHQACEKARVQRLDLAELKKLLPGSRRHKFIANKTVKSQIHEGKSRWCAVFSKESANV